MGSVIIIAIVIAAVVFQSWKKAKKRSGSQRKETEMPFQHIPKTAETGSAEDSAAFFSRQPVQKENILAAAWENTVETAVGNDMDSLASEMLMRNVYELMVKGPKDSLTFSRDFVSEGTDMLNRYTTLPDTDLF